MQLNMLEDKILVQPKSTEKTTKSGIFIPDQSQEKPSEGIVMSVGTKCWQLKKGDYIFYPKHIGAEIQVENVDYLLMKEGDVLCALIQ